MHKETTRAKATGFEGRVTRHYVPASNFPVLIPTGTSKCGPPVLDSSHPPVASTNASSAAISASDTNACATLMPHPPGPSTYCSVMYEIIREERREREQWMGRSAHGSYISTQLAACAIGACWCMLCQRIHIQHYHKYCNLLQRDA